MAGTYGLTERFEDGDVVFEEGDSGDEMFVITQGAVRVSRTRKGREVELATLREGDQFGEMALILSDPRSATVRAVGETTLRKIDRRGFMSMPIDDPLIMGIMRTMAERIRSLDEQLAQLDVADQVRKEHVSTLINYRHQFV